MFVEVEGGWRAGFALPGGGGGGLKIRSRSFDSLRSLRMTGVSRSFDSLRSLRMTGEIHRRSFYFVGRWCRPTPLRMTGEGTAVRMTSNVTPLRMTSGGWVFNCQRARAHADEEAVGADFQDGLLAPVQGVRCEIRAQDGDEGRPELALERADVLRNRSSYH